MLDSEFIIKTIAIPVASALIGSFVTTARNEALVATKLDHIFSAIQRIEQDQKENGKLVAVLKEDLGVFKYRIENLEGKVAKEGRVQERR